MAKKKFQKTPKLPQAASAEEIEARDKLEDAKQKARAGRRAAADCDDKPKKKKGDESSSDYDDDDSEDGLFEQDESEEEEAGEVQADTKKPKSLLDQLGVQLDGAVNLNTAAKTENKAVSAKNAKLDGAKPELSRKEREAIEAQRKAEAYRKKHEAGETDEAKSDLARLAEVRRRREEAQKKRDAEAADEAEKAAEAEAKKAPKGPAAKIQLPKPTQKDVKSALLKLQDCASDEFQKKWKLNGASGNKLAKMKYGEFTKLWEDFLENGSDEEHRQYAA